jgi:NAD(P)H-hydrate epimerase
MVIDADGLNNLAQLSDFGNDIKGPVILTPHPGELRRLATAMSIHDDATTNAQRIEIAEELARRVGCIVVLKGAITVITDGQQSFEHGAPNPAMATGGTGDVLTGIIASLVAQFWNRSADSSPDLLTLARLAVQLHADAGARWAHKHGNAGMLATDLCDLLPQCMNEMRQP